jgi:hypothetical protein
VIGLVLFAGFVAHILINIGDPWIDAAIKIDFGIWLFVLCVLIGHGVILAVNLYRVGVGIVDFTKLDCFHFNLLLVHSVNSDRDNLCLVHPGLIGQLLELVSSVSRGPKINLLFHVLSIANSYTVVNRQYYPKTNEGVDVG